MLRVDHPAPDAGGAMDGGGSLPSGNPEIKSLSYKTDLLMVLDQLPTRDSATGQIIDSTIPAFERDYNILKHVN